LEQVRERVKPNTGSTLGQKSSATLRSFNRHTRTRWRREVVDRGW
jgi:hypothetical protein